MNQIEQNDAGEIFSLCYQDSGEYFCLVIDNTGIVLDKIEIMDILQIDMLSTPIDGFHEPLITCSFLNNDVIFIQMYHRKEKVEYHFHYNFRQ